MCKLEFRENLRDIMTERHLSQAQIAKGIGVSQRAVSKWLSGQSEPTATNICNLAKFLETTTDSLLGLDL